MQEILINHSEKGFLSERESVQKRLVEGWKSIFKNCSKNEAILLENIVGYQKLLEAGQTGDISGYDGFVLNLVRRVYANMIAKDLVSVQPMVAPTGRVFYLDPMITTGTSTDFQRMHEAHYDSSNYDVSKGAYTTILGTSTGITESNYNSGTSFNIPYSGGSEGLASLEILLSASTNLVELNGANGEITQTAVSPNVSISNTALTFDYSTVALCLTQKATAIPELWIKFKFNTTPTNIVNGYSMSFSSIYTAASWQFCGSTDDTTWVLLDSQTNQFPVGLSTYSVYETPSVTTPYMYYILTGITNGVSGIVRITEVQLLSNFNPQTTYFAISPTTWTQDIFSENMINVVVRQSGTTFSGTAIAQAQWKDYTGTEAVSTMQEIKLNVTSSTVEATTRKIKGKFTEELMQDMDAYFGMNLESELAELMSLEVSSEIDREIIRDLINIAPYRDEWYYDMYALTAMTGFITGDTSSEIASARTQYRWAQDSLLTKINKMDAQIRKSNIYHGANWLVCSTKVGTIIESMPEHNIEKSIGIMDVERIHKTGKLKSTINVYVDPYLPDNICLLGYNGSNWDAGYIYAPYIISDINPIRDPDTLFEHDMEFMTRYAKKIVTNKKYGLIDCRFPTGDEYKIINEGV